MQILLIIVGVTLIAIGNIIIIKEQQKQTQQKVNSFINDYIASKNRIQYNYIKAMADAARNEK